MTRTIKLIGLLIIVVLATTGCHYVRRNFRGRLDHSRMERYSRVMEFRHMERMGMGPAYGIRRRMRPMGPGQMGRNDMRIERIPGLTDTQRKEIADLRQKQMQEMDKLHEETFAKMQSLREENRTKMMSLLTDEQKKFLESGPSAARQETPPASK
jgi:Spy/CpxP family protein refolding chaperone